MNIMTKRGNLDNVITYEHICDTTADMNNIDPQYITLGSICIVINNEDSGMEVYMANSNKEWNSIAMGAGSSDSGSGASSLMDLLDVEVLNPTDGQTLTYDATAGKWVNSNAGSSSTGGIFVANIVFDEELQKLRLDKTAAEIVAAIEAGKVLAMSYEILSDDDIHRRGLIFSSYIEYSNDESYISIDITENDSLKPSELSDIFYFIGPVGATDMNFYPIEDNGG